MIALQKTWHEHRLVTVLVGAWVLTMISLPIVRVFAGVETFNWGVTLSVVLQAAAVLAVLQQVWGWQRTLQTALIVAVFSWGVEALGSKTGFPFGPYHYTESLQPQVFGVPLLIPLAWLMMLPVAWAIAQLLVGQRPWWRFVALSAVILTAWDLFLDPQMVAWGYWIWENPGGYFGIPWSNYAGWLLTAAVLTLVSRPAPLPPLPLLLIYTITWALESIGLIVFWRLVGPGLVGFLAMGIFVVLGWRAVRQ